MKLHDPTFIAFDGTPSTGSKLLARGVTLAVYGVGQLTPEQYGGVAHAYKLFKDALRVSLGTYLVRERKLEDGTRVRMTSNNGLDYVQVWPSSTGGEHPATLRGFVVSPMFVTGTTPTAKYDTDFLVMHNNANEWKPYGPKYQPGAPRTALPYSVSAVTWTGAAAKVKLPKTGFKGWPGTKIRGVHPMSDDKFNDVYAVKGQVLYRNAIKVKGFPVAPGGMPTVFPQTDGYGVLFISDLAITRPVSIGASLFSWSSFFLPVLPGYQFSSGPELYILGTSRKARYEGFNILETKAIQFWQATCSLTDGASANATQTGQLNVPGALADNSGWVDTAVSPTTAPIVTAITTRARLVGFKFSTQTGAYLGESAGGIGSVTATGSNLSRVFQKTYSLPENLPLNETEMIDIVRRVVIDSETRNNNATYWNTWNESAALQTGSFGPFGGYWVQNPADTGGGLITSGTDYTAAYTENVERLTHSDTATCTATVPATPDPIYKVDTTHAINGKVGTGDNIELGVPTGLGVSGSPGNTWAGMLFPKSEHWNVANVSNVYTNADEKIGTNTIVASARDFIYSDRANETFLWIEAVITSTATDEDHDVGSSEITITTNLQFNGTKHSAIIYHLVRSTPSSFGRLAPWGINFGTSHLNWGYHAPIRPDPIYAPRWQEQGLCPYIAYTTNSEHAAGVTPGCAAFFRLQLIRTIRGLDEPDLVSLPDCVGFNAYMVEQLLLNYGSINTKPIFDAFEATPTIVKFATDSNLFANIGAPVDDATEFANFYRT